MQHLRSSSQKQPVLVHHPVSTEMPCALPCEKDSGCFAKKISVLRKCLVGAWERGWIHRDILRDITLSFLEGEWTLPKAYDWGKGNHIPQDWSLFGCTLANVSCLMSWAYCGHLTRHLTWHDRRRGRTVSSAGPEAYMWSELPIFCKPWLFSWCYWC